MSQHLIYEIPIECQAFEGTIHRLVHQIDVSVDNILWRVPCRAVARVDQDVVVRISPHKISAYIEEN